MIHRLLPIALAALMLAGANMYVGMGVIALSPAGFGVGQAYAGDPLRGVLIGAAAPALALGLGVLGDQVLFTGRLEPRPNGPTMLLVGLSMLGYGMWASHDAAMTAERVRSERHRTGAEPR